MMRHFLSLTDFSSAELKQIVTRAAELKAAHQRGARATPLAGRTLAMIFDKASTRTRVSVATAMWQLGGHAISMTTADLQLGRGEPVEDTARVLARMVDAVVIRTSAHALVDDFARYSAVPVINGLTDRFHPCQLLADVQTYQEHRGPITGRVVAWVGDGNNVCQSWMNAAQRFGFLLKVATPPGFGPDAQLLATCGEAVQLVDRPEQAARDADVVVTDTWASMGDEADKEQRVRAFAGYQVDEALMELARTDALFMHCLPAYRGMEVSAGVVDGPQSVIFDEAENRLHSHKALLEFLLVPA